MNKYLDKAKDFTPDLTPDEMDRLGVLVHPGSQYHDGSPKDNFFGISASMKAWPDTWHNDEHPQGWYQWYKGYVSGKRTPDYERQIKRWLSFKARHLAQLQKADPTLSDLSIQPKRRQALLNWGIAPGLDKDKALKAGNVNKYLEKVAKNLSDSDKRNRRALIGAVEGAAGAVLGGQIASLTAHPIVHKKPGYSKEFVDKVKATAEKKYDVRFNFDQAHAENPDMHKFTKATVKDIFTNPHNPSYLNKHIANKIPEIGKFKHSFINEGTGRNTDATLHEIGHARDFHTGKSPHIAHKMVSHGMSSFSPLGFVAGTAMMHNDKTKDYAWAAPAAAALPQLYNEGAANYHAMREIKAHGGKVRNYLATAALNTINYAAIPAMTGLGFHVANKYHSKKNKK